MNASDLDHEQSSSIVLANNPIAANHLAASPRGPEAVEVGRKRKFGEHQDEDQDGDDGVDTDTETIGSDGEPVNDEGSTSIIASGGANSRSSQSPPPSKRHHPDSDGHDSSVELPSGHASNPDVRALPSQHSPGTSTPSFLSLLFPSSTANANPIAAVEAHTVRSTTTIISEGLRPSMLQYHAHMSTIRAVDSHGNEDAYPDSDADRSEYENTSPSPVEEITTEGARHLKNDGSAGFISTFNGVPCPPGFDDGPHVPPFSAPCPSTFNAPPPTNRNANRNAENDFFKNFFESQTRANRAAMEASNAFFNSFQQAHSRNSGFRSRSSAGTSFSAGFVQDGVNVQTFTTANVRVTPVVSRDVPVVQGQLFHTMTPPSLLPPQTIPHTHLLALQTPPQTVFTPTYGHATPTSAPTLLPTTTNINNSSLRNVPPLAYTLPTRATRTLNQNINPSGAPGLAGFHAPSYA